ncbi:molybdenum cofactor guanylyltransferase MobA [Pseudovibrio sp. SPO723]|uniref:molybdenum cofactor guanylyltransferase MobA n=1 Tax=Nesiotobacter zosterae TaxID=392721 RepID=UPI0029C38B0A|nr:molybdenum cofactor guanylyltransferase MobA [Pseudovibrio sp. SPO723]MDX5593624.1 molybdenum cofactor guanylyltransferase MobA [Pseudovibrio sp. SPO723]
MCTPSHTGNPDATSAAAASFQKQGVRDRIIGCLLCGGQSRRMGGHDKTLAELNGRKLVNITASRLAPQVKSLVVSVNNPTEDHIGLDVPLLPDTLPGQLGPMAGILAAMEWARVNEPDAIWIVSAAADTPFFPLDLTEKLAEPAGSIVPLITMAQSREQLHPTFALWPIYLAEDIRTYLLMGGRSIQGFVRERTPPVVSFGGPIVDGIEVDPFFNINTPQDLEIAKVADASVIEAVFNL